MKLWQRWRDYRRERSIAKIQQEVGIRLATALEYHRQTAEDGEPVRPSLDQALIHLVANAQHIDATMCLLKMLIATHHDIRWLKRTWDLNAPQMTDRLFDAPVPFGNDTLKQVMLDAWKLSIQDFTRIIDEAAQAHRQDEDDET